MKGTDFTAMTLAQRTEPGKKRKDWRHLRALMCVCLCVCVFAGKLGPVQSSECLGRALICDVSLARRVSLDVRKQGRMVKNWVVEGETWGELGQPFGSYCRSNWRI